jgi:GWxTD domain-containing protein
MTRVRIGSLAPGRRGVLGLVLVLGRVILGALVLGGLGGPFPGPARAQSQSPAGQDPAADLPTRSLGPPTFYVDTTDLDGEPGSSGIRFTFSVPMNQLNFAKLAGGRYEAKFDVVAVLYDKKDRQAGGDVWRKRVTAATYKETKAQRKNFSFTADFSLPPGDYRLEVRMGSVGLESSAKAVRSVKVKPPSNATVSLSGVEVGTCRDSLTTFAVDPDSAGFLASLTRRFGDPLPHVCARGELYLRGGAAGGSQDLILRILGSRAAVVAVDTVRIAVQGQRTPFAAGVPIESLTPGTYVLELSAALAGDRAVSVRQFEIDASRIDLERNYGVFVDLAGYYLGESEVAPLRNVPPAERKARWEAFWKERDPDPATAENEELEQFLNRVRTAADRYAARGDAGWKTDRGKVYIHYGEPEDVENVPAGFNTPAYEIWRYPSRNLTFVFADQGGFGDYVLVQPSSPF